MNAVQPSVTESGEWIQLVPRGEFPHRESGRTQVIDERSIDLILRNFNSDAARKNFGGLLLDQDHFSYDLGKPSESYGWVKELQRRADGIWGRIEFSDLGEQAVRNRRYKFISPVFTVTEDLGGNRVRPVRLDSAGLTNTPNFRDMAPLANREGAPGSSITLADPDPMLPVLAANLLLMLFNREVGGTRAEKLARVQARYPLLNKAANRERVYANRNYLSDFTMTGSDQARIRTGAAEIRKYYEKRASWSGVRTDMPYFRLPGQVFTYGDSFVRQIARRDGITEAEAFDRLEQEHPLLFANMAINRPDDGAMRRLEPAL